MAGVRGRIGFVRNSTVTSPTPSFLVLGLVAFAVRR